MKFPIMWSSSVSCLLDANTLISILLSDTMFHIFWDLLWPITLSRIAAINFPNFGTSENNSTSCQGTDCKKEGKVTK